MLIRSILQSNLRFLILAPLVMGSHTSFSLSDLSPINPDLQMSLGNLVGQIAYYDDEFENTKKVILIESFDSNLDSTSIKDVSLVFYRCEASTTEGSFYNCDPLLMSVRGSTDVLSTAVNFWDFGRETNFILNYRTNLYAGLAIFAALEFSAANKLDLEAKNLMNSDPFAKLDEQYRYLNSKYGTALTRDKFIPSLKTNRAELEKLTKADLAKVEKEITPLGQAIQNLIDIAETKSLNGSGAAALATIGLYFDGNRVVLSESLNSAVASIAGDNKIQNTATSPLAWISDIFRPKGRAVGSSGTGVQSKKVPAGFSLDGMDFEIEMVAGSVLMRQREHEASFDSIERANDLAELREALNDR